MNSALAVLAALGERVLAVAGVAALVAAGALVLVRLTSPPPALRAAVWWLVAARVLAELAGAPALELALLPAPDHRSVRGPTAASAPVAAEVVVMSLAGPGAAVAPAPPERASPRAEPRSDAAAAGPGGWTIAFAGAGLLWCLTAGLALARALEELAAAHRRRRAARSSDDPAALAALARAGRQLGVRRAVELKVSEETAVPCVVGLFRPAIILPAASTFEPDELEMTLAHELAHVRRRDALAALVPLLAERLFAIHPLVRLAAREYALATEAACDALVLARVAPAPEHYGRLLLRFALSHGRTPSAAGWPLARRPLERRLEMISLSRIAHRPALAALAPSLVLAALIALPVRPVAAQPADEPAPVATPAPAAAPTPAAAPSAAAPRAHRPLPVSPPATPPAPWVPAVPPVAQTPAPPPLPPLPAIAPASPAPVATPAPTPPVPPVPPIFVVAGDLSLMLLDGDSDISIDASLADRRFARDLARDGEPVLVFRRADGVRHVTRDRATIDAVRGLFEEEVELAGERARLAAGAAREAGARAERAERRLAQDQARLAGQLEREMERLRQEMARLDGELARLRVESQGELEETAPALAGGDPEALERAARDLERRIERQRRERERRLGEILDRAEGAAAPDRP